MIRKKKFGQKKQGRRQIKKQDSVILRVDNDDNSQFDQQSRDSINTKFVRGGDYQSELGKSKMNRNLQTPMSNTEFKKIEFNQQTQDDDDEWDWFENDSNITDLVYVRDDEQPNQLEFKDRKRSKSFDQIDPEDNQEQTLKAYIQNTKQQAIKGLGKDDGFFMLNQNKFLKPIVYQQVDQISGEIIHQNSDQVNEYQQQMANNHFNDDEDLDVMKRRQ